MKAVINRRKKGLERTMNEVVTGGHERMKRRIEKMPVLVCISHSELILRDKRFWEI
jgi:hypothetical protein